MDLRVPKTSYRYNGVERDSERYYERNSRDRHVARQRYRFSADLPAPHTSNADPSGYGRSLRVISVARFDFKHLRYNDTTYCGTAKKKSRLKINFPSLT
jgi:hypothetical protein